VANEQNQASQNAEAQRRSAEQQRAAQQQGNTGVSGQAGSQQDPARRAVDEANKARRASFDQDKRATAERPQQVGDEGQKPTPTQQENDEIMNGLRHVDDKDDDGSGPDFVHNRVVRRVDADQSKGKYETR
jgi:hypothetical protein